MCDKYNAYTTFCTSSQMWNMAKGTVGQCTCWTLWTHTHARARAHTHTRTHTRAHARTRTRARTHTRTHARTHTRARTHAHTHTRTHTHRYQENLLMIFSWNCLFLVVYEGNSWYRTVLVHQCEHAVVAFFSIVKPPRCTNVSNLFYFGMTLYMFRTVFPSTTRSSRLYIQQQAFVKHILLSAC